ncbi:MAG: methyltransferase domain-containing protein, partial [Burkholderiales bacterium]
LQKRFPRARVISLDSALEMLPGRGWLAGLLPSRETAVCADLEKLPLADGSIDLVWSNMALHWLSDPLPAFREFARVLAPEGLLMFSTLGPDTLKELRAAAGAARVHAFIDMHDLGDMLVAAGMSAPVMDMELIEIEYRSTSLVDDLRASGQTNARTDRPRGLSGLGFNKRLGTPPRATFEVVYGHAWSGRKVEPEAKTVRIFKRMP